ncbi:hypothetical protein REC12_26430 [Desulfosporosinus sp. PR]|uniref:hypothetical protein n=1 Tax=Candidatus Desulfosporosinus nitrosoreducens TaxID=3401928 RepID=UPI0027F25EE4|nr:hypothetical protein [Desulfosporosinus sp. PR]MDQ7097139.1 hypothetical protein [Desulfosporosinus sp. PR]
MPKITVICYLFSLLCYGLGSWKMSALKNLNWAMTDYTVYVSLATVYFVLTIFLLVLGSFFFLARILKEREVAVADCISPKAEAARRVDKSRWRSASGVKVQLPSNYDVKLERRLSS